MDEAAVGATIQVLLQNLISFSTNEIKLILHFKEDLEKLRITLNTIQQFVYGAEALQISDVSVQQWLKKLEDVAFEAYNVFDEVHYFTLRKASNKSAVKKKFNSVFSSPNRLKLGHKIGDINKEFELINREASDLGLPTRLAGLHAAGDASRASASSETDSFTFDSVFYGRDDDVKEIVEKLANIPTEEVFSVLPIVGMGGLGKTTLAREVVKVQTQFGAHIWVHVSTNFDPTVLFKKILEILTSEEVKVESKEIVLKKLQEALANITYLLVLDDVWNEEQIKWEGFINSLSGITSTKGNGIIVTTRKGDVASIVATLPIHKLQGVTEDNCWSIIKAKTFGGEIIPSEFEILGRNIAKSCQGLPLAANVVGGVLRGKSKAVWVSIQDNWLSDHVGGDFIKKVLKLSFDNLSSPSLKKCFAYCSIFPKGARIEREQLIQLWMAEGFLQPSHTNDMETAGNSFFNLLLHNSLLQAIDRDVYNNVLFCSMHDLVHDVATKVNNNISDGARYIGDESSSIPKEKAKYVRTLFSKDGSMFSDFKSLHVLTMMGYDVKELSSSIRELMHLRYLNISYTGIEYLPDTIGELYHLQTLRALSSSLKKLPSSLKYCVSLRHLHVYDQTKLPGELGNLTSLQTIPYFAVRDKKGHRIVELGSLKNLKGELKIYNLEKVKDEEEAKSACIFQKSKIVKLVLRWNESKEGEANYENVFEGLQPHPNLKSIHIFGFNGTRFPSWMKGLNSLMEIMLKSCYECEEIPMMGHLPHLKSLYLGDLKNVKSISSSFYGIDHCNGVVFPALERLELRNMPNMVDWEEVKFPENQSLQREVKVFPCLEYLEIRNCRQLRSAPTQFPCLKELEIYDMVSGLPLANICGIKLTSLIKLQIRRLEELECLPHDLFYNNQHLSKLILWNCPRLRELGDGLHTLSSLEEFNVQRCPSLKSILCSSSVSLRSLVVEDCDELMYLSCEMVAPSLECLLLRKLKKVTNMQMIIDCLHRMPRLRVLDITCVPKFIITETPAFRCLQQLSMGPDEDSWDCVSFKEAVDGVLRLGSRLSVGRLELRGMENWESLPDQLQHLVALRELNLFDYGIEELSDRFGNLSSLQELCLSSCKKLRRLPSVEAMGQLTKLSTLYIRDCPLLKDSIERRRDDDDSEWPKISHLSAIWVDFRNIRV